MIFQFSFIFSLFSIILSQTTEIYEITNLPTSNPSIINNQIQDLSNELYRLNLQLDKLFISVSNNTSLYQQVLNLSIKTNKLLNNDLVNLKNRTINVSNMYTKLTPTLSEYIKKVICLSNSECIPTPSSTTTTPLITTTLSSINDSLSCENLKQGDKKISNDNIEEVNCNWNLTSQSGNKYIIILSSFIVQGNASIIVHDNLNGKDVISANNSITNPIIIDSNEYNYNISIHSENSISGVQFEINYKKLNVCDVDTCSNNGKCIVSPENTPKCMCSGCLMSSTNCHKKYNPCDTYLKCKTVDENNNPTGNICKPLETSDTCTAQCFCKGSQVGKPFCS